MLHKPRLRNVCVRAAVSVAALASAGGCVSDPSPASATTRPAFTAAADWQVIPLATSDALIERGVPMPAAILLDRNTGETWAGPSLAGWTKLQRAP